MENVEKRISIISKSADRRNSDTLCDQFIQGAESAGNMAEKIYVHNQTIGSCMACYACKKTKSCIQKDDMFAILDKLVSTDVIVLATPVYFYSMDGQMKTLIDRTLPRYTEIRNKDFYFIATAADGKVSMERTIDGLRGFTDCLAGANVRGVVYGAGAWQKGDIQGNKAMKEAFDLGHSL